MSAPTVEHFRGFLRVHHEQEHLHCDKCGQPTTRVKEHIVSYSHGNPNIEVLRRCPNASWWNYGHVDQWCWQQDIWRQKPPKSLPKAEPFGVPTRYTNLDHFCDFEPYQIEPPTKTRPWAFLTEKEQP